MPRYAFWTLLALSYLTGLRAEGLWSDNKLTPEQPFPAAVRAIHTSWPGYELLLEEIGGSGRLCVAQIWHNMPLTYTLIKDRAKEVTAEPERKKAHWTYLSPTVELNRFSWSMDGIARLGRVFGEEDLLRKCLAAAHPSPRQPSSKLTDLIQRQGDVALSDGSSHYRFSRDGRFASIPFGLSGRTMEGFWSVEQESGRVVAIVRLGWINGIASNDEYRRIEFYIGEVEGDTPVKTVESFGQKFPIFHAYFFIDTMTKIPKPENGIEPPSAK